MLPHVDEPRVLVEADASATWAALVHVLGRSFGGSSRAAFATLVGCEHVRPNGVEFPNEGAVVTGFAVRASDVGQLLDLAGRHRFSKYSLTFRLEERSGGTEVRAETRAAFPGLAGRLYPATGSAP